MISYEEIQELLEEQKEDLAMQGSEQEAKESVEDV